MKKKTNRELIKTLGRAGRVTSPSASFWSEGERELYKEDISNVREKLPGVCLALISSRDGGS